VGLLLLEDDISPELAQATIKSIKVFGSFHADKAVKEALAGRTLKYTGRRSSGIVPAPATRYNSPVMAYKVLVVDDEKGLLSTVRLYLEGAGYVVQTATDGRSALHTFRTFQPDLVVLDIMLPGIDGLEVLRQLRQSSNVYVIMLTAKAEETDKIVGLTVGADDYVTKPFSPRELVARVRAALRRIGSESGAKTEEVSRHLRLDADAHLVWKDEKPLELTPIEFDLLRALMRHHGRALSREQLIEHIWGYDYYGDERVVDVHIGRLRKKIEDDPSDPKLIVTVWGAGYRFEDETA
jgi:two-component system, OmpR family, alkaline phosphatase synthesis response regulator PhoP